MTIDTRLLELQLGRQDLLESHKLLKDTIDQLTKGGGGGGPGLEQRVTRLEGRIDDVIDRLGKVETAVAVVSEKVSHLPTKGFVVSGAIGTIAALTAVITFGEKLQALVH